MKLQEDLQQAANFFGIGIITAVSPAAEGMGNANHFVTTSTGEYVLRVLGTQTVEGLENEVAIERQLKLVGVRTAELQTGEGGKYYYELGNQRITCAKRIEGAHPSIRTPELCYELGRILAKFHAGVTHLPHTTHSWIRKEVVLEEIGKREKDSFIAELQSVIDSSIDIFEAEMPKGVVHGDLHLSNLVVTQEGEIVIFDFEEATPAFLLFDIAMTATALYKEGASNNSENIGALIEGYESLRTLTPIEKENFNKAVLFVSAAAALWIHGMGHPDRARKCMQEGYWVVELEATAS